MYFLLEIFFNQLIFLIDPAEVTVTGCGGNHVDEGDDCTLSCGTSGGFPMVLSYIWEFKRKFENNFDAIQQTYQSYRISSLNYMHAGEYRCSATNIGGTSTDSKTVNVRCKYL